MHNARCFKIVSKIIPSKFKLRTKIKLIKCSLGLLSNTIFSVFLVYSQIRSTFCKHVFYYYIVCLSSFKKSQFLSSKLRIELALSSISVSDDFFIFGSISSSCTVSDLKQIRVSWFYSERLVTLNLSSFDCFATLDLWLVEENTWC